ncbi:hypothetical protein DUNSADRAFT_1151 [Dunaliella salina]|uniref:Uncharacterized protein n=1 Tax=Dunaliella salina TaxID=3046 RepID=A0ABQ7FXU6_DUNSA|nr:hypothetical protein DUNSADRAFT_1151 [Dunaliella salina]|eukprot:KAF5827192.1 hypothetical protein DUNSADRAFT_1151 [Dunaliella salina]
MRLGVLLSALPTLQVLRLTRIRSPCLALRSCFLAFGVRDNASSVRELHLEGADGCNLSPALPAISVLTGLHTLSLSHNIGYIEPPPPLMALSSLQQLKHLTVLGFSGPPLVPLSERPLVRLLGQLPHLQSFESYYDPSPEVIAALPQSLTSLHCMGSNRYTIDNEYTEALNGLRLVREAVCAQRLPHLRELVLKQVSFLPKPSEAWTSTLWVDIAQHLAQSMSIPGVAVAVKDVSLENLEAFAVFCSLVPSVAEHIEFIEMTWDPHIRSSLVPMACSCPNLAGLSIQSAHPEGDLTWLYQALTLFKGLRKVEFSDEPYMVTSPGDLVGSELPSLLRASADATKRTQPLEFKCSFTMDSIANDDKAFEQSMRQEVGALEESVKASCATIRDPQKRIDFQASVDIDFPDDGYVDFDEDTMTIVFP